MKVRAIAAPLVLLCGCAQIESHSTVTTDPIPNAPAVVLGHGTPQLVAEGADVHWSQDLNTLQVTITQTHRCREVRHRPVERVETVDRTVKHGALYWEYSVAAAVLGLGIAALARPQAFSPQAVNESGEPVRDTATGTRVGAVFTALGVGALGIAVFDTVRSRDTVHRTQAYAVTLGDTQPCPVATSPLANAEVELAVGEWTTRGTTDAAGTARFALPPESSLELPQRSEDATPMAELPPDTPPEAEAGVESPASPPAASPGSEAPAADPASASEAPATALDGPPARPAPAIVLDAVVRLGASQRSVAVDFVAPFTHPEAREHRGHASVQPQPIASATVRRTSPR